MKFPPGYVPGSGVHKASGFGGFGERLLRQQGWEKGEGLGKHKTGRAEAIQVKKKEDTTGVGANRSQVNSTKWWEGAFDTALTVINHEEPDSDSDSDISTADEVTVQVHNSDGTTTTAAQHELQIAAELAAQPAWFGGGRFGGREGKLARIRQQEALAAAKLGLPSSSPELKPITEGAKPSKKRKTAPSTAEDQSTEAPATIITVKKKKGSRKRKAQEDPITEQPTGAANAIPAISADVAAAAAAPVRKRVVIEPAVTNLAPAVPFVPTPAAGWWGAKKFKSAGCLEGLEQQRSRTQSERQEFDEDDQTKLYMAAQNLKTSGKKGLGTKSHIGKVAGAAWQGSKTTFDDEAKAEPDVAQEPASQEAAATHSQESQRNGAQSDHQELPKIKWKKMATVQLSKAKQKQMKMKTLQSALIQEALTKHCLSASEHGQLLRASLSKALTGSSQFVITGKSISLAV